MLSLIKKYIAGFMVLIGTACFINPSRKEKATADLPNIIYILADDMGYGDVASYNPASKIPTPHMDRIAREGMKFTDAHSPSAVCTPTRYGILTGRYCWRTPLKNGVLWSYSLPLIEPGRPTVASFLKESGYNTGCIGKWHLGLGWQTKRGAQGPWNNSGGFTSGAIEKAYNGKNLDFSKPFTGGPLTAGFDYCYGIPASLDMEPYIYFENNKITAVPVDTIEEGRRDVEGYYRKGPIAPDFAIPEVLPQMTRKAVRDRKSVV